MRACLCDIVCSIYNCHSCIATFYYVYIQIYSIDDTETVLTRPVVESFTITTPDEEIIANENTSEQLPIESVTLQAEELCVLVDGGVKEMMVAPSQLPTGRSDNVSHSTQIQSSLPKQHQSSSIPNGKCVFVAELSFSFSHNYNIIGMQGETTEQSYSSSPEKNIAVDPLSNTSSSSSHRQAPAGQMDQSTIPTGMLI